MSHYVGVVKLDNPIPCLKEVSGKRFNTVIAGQNVLIIFPSIPDTYDGTQKSIENGDLIVPINVFKVNWGTINAWPKGLFSVNAFLCYINAESASIHKVYEEFPLWNEKLNRLHLINVGDFTEPAQKMPTLLVGGGFYDGIEIFESTNANVLQKVINHRSTAPIKLHFVESKEAYSENKLSELFKNTGIQKEIALAYELLIMAYRAMERHDFRSAVILAGSAVEDAILKRIRQEYTNMADFDRDKKNHRMLGGKFQWLLEKNIIIPVSDYKTTIKDLRNDVVHDGVCPTLVQTKLCLESCKKIIETYVLNVLET